MRASEGMIKWACGEQVRVECLDDEFNSQDHFPSADPTGTDYRYYWIDNWSEEGKPGEIRSVEVEIP